MPKNEDGIQPKSTSVVTRFLERAFVSAGLNAEHIFERADIDPDSFGDAQYRIPHDKLLRMWKVASELSGDPNFGLNLAQSVPIAPFNAAGYLAMTSENLREAIANLQKYFMIFNDDGTFSITEKDDIARLRVQFLSTVEPDRQHTDFWQVYTCRHLISIIGLDIPFIEVGFQYEKPRDLNAYDDIFGCKLLFSQKENYIKFPSRYLDYQALSSDTSIHKAHEMQAVQQLHALTEDGILNKVKRSIFEALPAENIELQHVAESLNLTPRTVQRNLAEEGTSFKQLVDEARRDYTLSEIRHTDFSVSEVAFHLGYRELSSFYRAFKRWTGVTPAEYRAKHKDDKI